MSSQSAKTMLLQRLRNKQVPEDKIRLILEETHPLEQRRWEIIRSEVRHRSADALDVYVLLCRNNKEPILLASSVSAGPFIYRRRIDHYIAEYLNAFYQQRPSMPMHIFVHSFSTDIESENPLERFTDRWKSIAGESWLKSSYHIIQQQKELPPPLDQLASWTHPEFDAFVRERAAACYQEWYGEGTGTLQIRMYLEPSDPIRLASPADIQHYLETGEETPHLIVDIGGADPAHHPVTTLHFDLWHGCYGDHTWDANQLWGVFRTMVSQ
ncbi:hypothetical protein [Paenibacillus shenyangensis]|uniref:hypothetical protein n=1 Tax=Paenibacillus sp. A9 TaxID=1284352 RepID=UPI00036174E8|nr:hypothetical protein [Paenibacillus sp. A9]